MSGLQWVALGQAVVWVGIVRAMLAVVPWRRVAAASEAQAVHAAAPDWDRARAVVWAVEAVARRVLPERPCLTQALVAQRLLRKHGVDTQLLLGAARIPGKPLQAHAWLERDGKIVIGHIQTEVPYTAFRPVSPLPTSARP